MDRLQDGRTFKRAYFKHKLKVVGVITASDRISSDENSKLSLDELFLIAQRIEARRVGCVPKGPKKRRQGTETMKGIGCSEQFCPRFRTLVMKNQQTM